MIEASALHKRFGDKHAVARLDLRVDRGEFFCFLGPNGAGKTTTIKMINGLVKPTSGSIAVAGYDVQKQPLEAKQRLGYVPDHPFLYDKLTGREMMRFVGGLYDMADPEINELCDGLFEQFEITAVADTRIENYSHGMRQKLSFACCFLHRPEVVVVDEPWVGLDPKNIHRVKSYLREQTNQGLTVFMSTHSLSIAEEVADRVGIIHRGQLLKLGTVEEIKGDVRAAGSLEEVFLELTRDEHASVATPPFGENAA